MAWPHVPRLGVPCCEGWWARRGVGALLVVAAMRGLVCWLCVLLQRCWWCVRASHAHRAVLRTGVCMHKCITSAEGVCCSNVCAQACIPLCKKCVVHTCVRTRASPSAKGVCRAYVCVHTHPTLQGVYVMYTCVHARTCILFTESAFHAHMCTHTCVTSAEGEFCARVLTRTPLCRTPVLTRGVQVSAHTCVPGSPHLLHTQRCRVGVPFAPLLCRAGFISPQLAAPLLPSRA